MSVFALSLSLSSLSPSSVFFPSPGPVPVSKVFFFLLPCFYFFTLVSSRRYALVILVPPFLPGNLRTFDGWWSVQWVGKAASLWCGCCKKGRLKGLLKSSDLSFPIFRSLALLHCRRRVAQLVSSSFVDLLSCVAVRQTEGVIGQTVSCGFLTPVLGDKVSQVSTAGFVSRWLKPCSKTRCDLTSQLRQVSAVSSGGTVSCHL